MTCKVKNTQPLADKMQVALKSIPHISKFIHSFIWNEASKTAEIVVFETPKLEAISWIRSINEKRKEAQKGPFVDLEEDAITLTLFDDLNKEVGEFKFSNFDLLDHECSLYNGGHAGDYGIGTKEYMLHTVKLKYEKCEQLSAED